MIRDYTPDVSIDNHEGDSEDLPILSARHLNVDEPLFEEGKSMVIDWMYGAAAAVRLVDGPVQHRRRQPRGHPAQHGRAEERHQHARRGARRGAAPPVRPRAARTRAPNEHRKVYGAPVGELGGHAVLQRPPGRRSWRSTRRPRPTRRRRHVGQRTVLRGSYPWPLTPSVGENPNDQPDVDTPLASPDPRPGAVRLLHPAGRVRRCRARASARRRSSRRVAERLAIHGIKVEPQAGGVLVPLKQPLRRPGRADAGLGGACCR